MPRKAREILKARGYSDEELNGIVMLNDQRFVSVLEAEDAERERLASENARVTRDLTATQQWFTNEANPTLLQWQGEVVKTRSEIARLEAQLKAEQELGMRRVADGGSGGAGAGAGGGSGAGTGAGSPGAAPGAPDYTQYDQRYIGADTFKQAFSQVPDVAVTLYELGENHRELFGKRLDMRDLRSKFGTASQTGFKGSLEDFWAKEYNVPTVRAEKAAEAEKARVAKIRQEVRQELASEYMNPATRPPQASNSPFIRKQVTGGAVDGKNPWDKGTVEQRRSERVIKHGTKVLSGAA